MVHKSQSHPRHIPMRYIAIWVFSEIGVPPHHPFLVGCSTINHPFGGTSMYGNPHIYSGGPYSFSRLSYFEIILDISQTHHDYIILKGVAVASIHIPPRSTVSQTLSFGSSSLQDSQELDSSTLWIPLVI